MDGDLPLRRFAAGASRHHERVPIFRRRPSSPDVPLAGLSDKELGRLYRGIDRLADADDDPDARAARLDAIAEEVVRRAPEIGAYWYDRGMYAKWRRDWTASRTYNLTALDLIPSNRRREEAAAWNLGIAATALGDWPTARRAWADYGLPIRPDDDPAAEIDEDFGPAPVRLNAEPRFIGEPPLLIDGQGYATEVVWGRRLCPARIRIENVPTPESGHRFGDVVLHDGDTVGTRRFGDREMGVFNEIALWRRSPLPTLTATVTAESLDAVDDVVEAMLGLGGAAQDWTTTVRMLCRACSEGSPDDGTHGHGDLGTGSDEHLLGIAGHEDDARRVLTAWAAASPGRRFTDLTVVLE
jgi:hypothetical protein